MKWTFVIQQKLKVALLLACIMALVVISSLLERQNMKRINNGFTSIYTDRLVPAIDLFYLNEHIYQKQLLLTNFLSAPGHAPTTQIRETLLRYNYLIDSLITDYEKTYLVRKESEYLGAFKLSLRDLKMLEESALSLYEHNSIQAAIQLFSQKSTMLFAQITEQMSVLIKIQSTVGSELFKDSKSIVDSSHILSTLQIVIAVIIGMIVQVLVFSSKLINRSNDKYKLN